MARCFRARAQIAPDATALIQDERTLSYGQLNDRVNRLAHVLANIGLRRGDRLALMSRNDMTYVEVELAAAKLGIIVAALNWAFGRCRNCYTALRWPIPSLLIVTAEYSDLAARLDLDIAHSLVLGEEYEHLLARADNHEPIDQVHSEDALVIIYTSGTTGLPKGAVVQSSSDDCQSDGLCLRSRFSSRCSVCRLGAVLSHGVN